MAYPVPSIKSDDNQMKFQIADRCIPIDVSTYTYRDEAKNFEVVHLKIAGYGDDVFLERCGNEIYFNHEYLPEFFRMAGVPVHVNYDHGECDDCGCYEVVDILMPSGVEYYYEGHFGNTNYPGTWEEFMTIVESERVKAGTYESNH